MPYKLSERLNQDSPAENSVLSVLPVLNDIDLDKVRNVFLFFCVLGLVTAWVFSFDTKTILKSSVKPIIIAENEAKTETEAEENYVAVIDPIIVNKFNEVYGVTIYSKLPENSWAFVEGEVLDAEKDYLFSFGQELWHETGYDDEGQWKEAENNYNMKISFPKPGKYYLNLKSQGSFNPDTINVIIKKHLGSSIPHTAFGIICLLIGIVLNEIQNKTISRSRVFKDSRVLFKELYQK